jgi:hypothetical protein
MACGCGASAALMQTLPGVSDGENRSIGRGAIPASVYYARDGLQLRSKVQIQTGAFRVNI